MWKDGETTISRSFTLTTACIFPFIFFVFLVEVVTTTSERENLIRDIMVERFTTAASRSELLDMWHTDCHRRCFLQLEPHINLACRFDPYKVERKRRSAPMDRQIGTLAGIIHSASNSTRQSSKNETAGLSPFIEKHKAKSFLRNEQALSNPPPKALRRTKRDNHIMNECCIQKACAWEEFGEYCHGHLRNPHERSSFCRHN